MHVNYLAIALAGIASWILGALWYSPFLFGKKWQKEIGMTDEQFKKGNIAIIFGGSLLMMVLMAYGMYPWFVLQKSEGNLTLIHGFLQGIYFGVFFACASLGITYLYQRKSLKLFIIDGLFQVLMLGVAGLVLAFMI